MEMCVCLFMKVRRDRGKNKRTEAESPFRHTKKMIHAKKKKSHHRGLNRINRIIKAEQMWLKRGVCVCMKVFLKLCACPL